MAPINLPREPCFTAALSNLFQFKELELVHLCTFRCSCYLIRRMDSDGWILTSFILHCRQPVAREGPDVQDQQVPLHAQALRRRRRRRDPQGARRLVKAHREGTVGCCPL